MRIVEDASEKVAQAGNHADRFIISFLANQAAIPVQGVEQEVRFNLPSKRLKPGRGKLFVQARSFCLLQSQSLA